MKKLDEIQNKINKLAEKKYKIEQEEIERVQYPRIKALVGVCLKSTYNDGYYRKVLDYIDNKKNEILYLVFEEFYISKEGEASLSITSETPYTNKEWWNKEIPIVGYEKTTEEEYQREKTKMIHEMSTQDRVKKHLLKEK